MAANPYDHLTFLDAPRIAPQLLARGDPMGAVYSFIDPDQLTPDELLKMPNSPANRAIAYMTKSASAAKQDAEYGKRYADWVAA